MTSRRGTMEYDTKNKVLALMEFVLNFYGIYPFVRNTSVIRRNWMFVYSCIMFSIMILGNVFLITLSDNVESTIPYMSVVIGVLYFVLVLLLSAQKTPNLRDLIAGCGECDEEWLVTVRAFGIHRKFSHNTIIKIHNLIAGYNIVSFALVMAFPLSSVSLKWAKMGDASSLLYTSWYPWNVREKGWYILTYVVQTFSGFLVQSILYTTTAFNFMVLYLFRNDFNELQNTVHRLNDETVDVHFENYLKICIRRHQLIVRNFNEYKSWFDMLYASELTYYTSEFLLLGFSIFTDTQDVSYKARNVLLVLNITLLLYIHCFIGEEFYSMNDKVREIAFMLPWRRRNLNLKKTCALFMLQLQRPLQLTAFKTFRASLPVFFTILKSSYSFLNLLVATLK